MNNFQKSVIVLKQKTNASRVRLGSDAQDNRLWLSVTKQLLVEINNQTLVHEVLSREMRRNASHAAIIK